MRSISPRTERSGRPQKASTTFHSDFWCRRVRRLGFHTPDLRTDGDRLAAVPHFAALSRLLDLGAVKAAYPRVTAANFEAQANQPFSTTYRTTPFGWALLRYLAVSIASPDDAELHRLISQAANVSGH